MTKPVIISNSLKKEEEDQLVQILKRHKVAIGQHISDLKGINPSYCMHKINLETNFKPVRQPQRRNGEEIKEKKKMDLNTI